LVLYAEDMSIIITDSNKLNFRINLNRTFNKINTWFNDNLLTLNFQKTQYLEFRTRNSCKSPTLITYDQKSTTTDTETKFLGLIIDGGLSWNQHIDYIINKLPVAYYAIRNIKYTVTIKTLRLIYFAHVHSIMSYGII
jgi:hypothetical protein